MIGLDTNVVLRYLLQDDPIQSKIATRLIDLLSLTNPGFISIATILEIVWVLRSLLKFTPTQIAANIDLLLAADTLHLQNEQQVFEAAFALKRGLGEFEDALIGASTHGPAAPKQSPLIAEHLACHIFACSRKR